MLKEQRAICAQLLRQTLLGIDRGSLSRVAGLVSEG